jgi:polyhydroxyalkanoate synthesis regulator phasin
MSTDGEKRKDPGDAVREGIRSMIGILGALKDAVEDTFEELRTGGESTPDEARDAAKSTFQAAQDAVEDVRERLDFITRREFDALRAQVDDLTARVNTLGESVARAGATRHEPTGAAGSAPRSASGAGASAPSAGSEPDAASTGEAETPPAPDSPPPDEGGTDDPQRGDYRFEVE